MFMLLILNGVGRGRLLGGLSEWFSFSFFSFLEFGLV